MGQTLIADQDFLIQEKYMKTRYSDRTQWVDTTLSLTLESFHNYTQCVKLHTECVKVHSVCVKKHSVINHLMGVKKHILNMYTLSVKVHSVCVILLHCVFLHTEYTSTLSVYIYRMCFTPIPWFYYTVYFYTHRVYSVCSFTHTV